MGPGDPPGPCLLRARLRGLLAAGAGRRGGSADDRTGRRACGADPTGRARRRRGLDGGGERDARLEARTRLRTRGGSRGVGGLPVGRRRTHLPRPPDAAPRSQPGAASRSGFPICRPRTGACCCGSATSARSARSRYRSPCASSAAGRRGRSGLCLRSSRPVARPGRGGARGRPPDALLERGRPRRLRLARARGRAARAGVALGGAGARRRPSSCRRRRAPGVSTWRRAIRHGSRRRRPPTPRTAAHRTESRSTDSSSSRRAGTSERGRTRGAPPADSAPRCAVRAAAESRCVRSRSFVR